MRIKWLCVVLLFVVEMLSCGHGQAQESSEIITVTGLYTVFSGEYQEVMSPCDSSEVWDVETSGSAFTALSQQYESLKSSGQLTKYNELFVELKGRYIAYEEESHSDGVFEATEFVRYSTAAADIKACGSECEDIYGADSPICLAQVDGQCGSSRNSCVAGHPVSHYEGDSATQHRWICAGLYGGDNAVCTLPILHGYVVDVISRLHGPLTLYGWAYNADASSPSIPVEIYADGPRGTGTLAATITANQPRADVNDAHNITGDHGFEWPVPTTYQSGTHQFYVYALDQTPTPTVRTPLSPAPITLRAPGHADYCKDHGPCPTGQGDCDSDSECQSGLACVDDVGANYGWRAIVDVCEVPVPGSDDYCRDHGPCSAGQGDCDSNSECASGLICVNNVGANYGWRAIVDVCEDPVPGHMHHCREKGPCAAGQGDCDSDSECASGLTCVNNVGATYGFAANIDVCEAPAPGSDDYCRDHGPCSVGQGDCDSNSECASGLACVDNVGATYGFAANIDVCEVPVPGSDDYCREKGPCVAGQGDCDSDSECASGLTCVNNVGANYGWRAIVDVCEASS